MNLPVYFKFTRVLTFGVCADLPTLSHRYRSIYLQIGKIGLPDLKGGTTVATEQATVNRSVAEPISRQHIDSVHITFLMVIEMFLSSV